MRHLRLVLVAIVVACGGAPRSPAPVANAAPSPSPDAPRAARMVSRSPAGGCIVLTRDTDQSRAEADRMMNRHCGRDSYQIVAEQVDPVTGPDAWRIDYLCM
jgi:hypothetical protein